MRRITVRVAVIAVVAGAAILGVAGTAQAHTEVEIDKPQAGATNVTMTMTAEAESDSAGIASLTVVLPTGITAGEITVVSVPTGWTLKATRDGYTIGGTALEARTDARTVTRIAQLPADTAMLVFKTMVTYSDGQVDRWIEVPSPGGTAPDNPAPVVSLRPASATAAVSSTPAAITPPLAAATTNSPGRR